MHVFLSLTFWLLFFLKTLGLFSNKTFFFSSITLSISHGQICAYTRARVFIPYSFVTLALCENLGLFSDTFFFCLSLFLTRPDSCLDSSSTRPLFMSTPRSTSYLVLCLKKVYVCNICLFPFLIVSLTVFVLDGFRLRSICILLGI